MIRMVASLALTFLATGPALAQDAIDRAQEREWDRLAEENAQERLETPPDPFDLVAIRTKFATNPMLERMEVRARATFRGIDLLRDGEVTAEELSAERRRTFRGADANGDNRLTIGEFMGYFGRLGAERLTDYFWQGDVQKEFYRLDINLNRRLSADEWNAPAIWFIARYDLNRDLTVEEDEYVRELLPNTRQIR